jgi:HD-GYP domain-containing protein (c-di-GMP phosphodiesterase class II)
VLLCGLDNAQPGMKIAGVVLHPRRPELELLSPGATLDASILARLRRLGVAEIWIQNDATADLDGLLNPRLSAVRREIYARIKQDFARLEQATISTAQVQSYRKTVMELVCEIISNRRLAGLTEQLFSDKSGLFTHCANVAFLAALAGLELETYIVSERRTLTVEHARDLPTLGLGGLLHDIGKTALPASLRECHEAHARLAPPPDSRSPESPPSDALAEYRRHALIGYIMLRGSRAPASATQAVLNHHQRFDGTGWPDMAEATHNRRQGAQAGRQIHVFSRIVNAANVLDNLLRDAQGARRPPVAALHDFASPRFDGWFDPVVRRVMLHRIPPFQVGSLVTLSDGRDAAVVAPCIRQPCRPMVRLLSESARGRDGHYPTLNLEDRPELRIVRWAGTPVEPWLFTLPGKTAARAAG